MLLLQVLPVAEVLVCVLSATSLRDVSLQSFGLVSFDDLLKGTGDLTSVFQKFLSVIFRERGVLDSGALVSKAADSLERLESGGRVREASKDEQGDPEVTVHGSEIDSSCAEVLTDQVHGVTRANLRIHSLEGKVRVNFRDSSDVVFILQLLILFSVGIDKDTTSLALLQDESTELVDGPQLHLLGDLRVVVLFFVAVLVDLVAESVDGTLLDAIFFAIIWGCREADDKDLLS